MSNSHTEALVYKGRVVSMSPPMVIVDDEGPDYHETFLVDKRKTPHWLDTGYGVTFFLVPMGLEKEGTTRTRFATNLQPQRTT